MTATDPAYEIERPAPPVEQLSIVQAISKAELDQQIVTAKNYPRSIKRFRDECLQMATLTEDIANECFYALPRDGKTVEGPSARLAEIVASAWGNCRASARIIEEGREFIVAQGRFVDLERNSAIEYEVRRRITDKRGNRYKPDMVAVTGNAACSIALRNAVFKGIPKAFWSDIYDAARKAAIGDIQTLANRRAAAMQHLQKVGATPDAVFAVLGVKSVEEITLDHLATLKGLATAIKEGETTVEQAFPLPQKDVPADQKKGLDGLAERIGATPEKKGKTPEPLLAEEAVVLAKGAKDMKALEKLGERVAVSKFTGEDAKSVQAALGERAESLRHGFKDEEPAS